MISSLDWGIFTIDNTPWRIQLYWPYIRIRKTKCQRNYKELIISADSVFRLVYEKGYFGMGIQILGFEIAFDFKIKYAK